MTIRETLDRWGQTAVVSLLLVILVFGPLAMGAVRAPEWLVIQGLAAVASALWLVRLWADSSSRILWPPISWTVVGFVAYGVIRYSQADLEYVARQELVDVVVYGLLFFLVLNNAAGHRTPQIISFALVFLGLVIALFGIFQFATGYDRIWTFVKPAQYVERGSGTYICPNHFAGFLEMVLPLGLAYTFAGRIGPVLRILLGYASLMILGGIAVSLSRAGWLATGIMLLILFAWLFRQVHWRLALLLFVAGLVVTVGVFYVRSQQAQKRVQRALTGGTSDDTRFRLHLAGPTLQMWRDHPWLGVGPGHFDYRFPQYRTEQLQIRPGNAHNDYLNTLADWGLVGMGIVGAALVLLFLGIRKSWRFVERRTDLGPRQGNRSAFVLGGSLGLVALLIHSLFDFNMHIPANAITAVALMGLLSAHLRYATDRYWVRPRVAGCLALTLMIGSAQVWLVRAARQQAREYRWLSRAEKEQYRIRREMAVMADPALRRSKAAEAVEDINAAWQRRIEWLKRAADVEPANFETAYEIGEAVRQLNWNLLGSQKAWVREAVAWFERASQLNSYDPYSPLRIGMCLDWRGEHAAATEYFKKSLALDPNNYYLIALYGWHLVQVEDYAQAKTWFERSLRIHWWNNPIATSYLGIVEQRLKMPASQK